MFFSRRMADPNAADWTKVKRVGRHLRARPRAVIVYKPQELPKFVDVEADSDFAGDIFTRRSTGGMVSFFGTHLIKKHVGSSVDNIFEFRRKRVLQRGARHGAGLRPTGASQAPLSDLRVTVGVRVGTYSTAAKGFASRRAWMELGMFLRGGFSFKKDCRVKRCSCTSWGPLTTAVTC